LLSLFRTNQASAGLLLFFYALLLQLPAFFGSPGEVGAELLSGLAGNVITYWFGDTRWLMLLLPVVLVTIQGIIANVLVTRHRLSRKITQFPGLFIVLCWGLFPMFRELQALHFANLFLMFALLSLARVYKKDDAAVPLFNAGAWLGIASLFVPFYLCLLPALIIGMGILRRPDVRSILQIFVGGALMYFLAFVLVYLFGVWEGALGNHFSALRLVSLPEPDSYLLPGLIALGILLLLVISWLLAFGALGLVFSSTALLPGLQVLVCPLGLLVGLRFILLAPRRAEFLHLILLVIAIGPLLWATFGVG